jgi:3-dehydroquinate dehydratase-2
MIAPVCSSSVVGFGPFGYHLAMLGIMQVITEIKGMQAQQAQAAAQD